MKPSTDLQLQMNKLQNIGSFRLSTFHKKELVKLLESNSLPVLANLSCGTCVRKSMYDLIRFNDHRGSTPVLQKAPSNGVLSRPMSMDKKPTEMNYKELRATCKAKGIKTGKHPKKVDLIKMLSK